MSCLLFVACCLCVSCPAVSRCDRYPDGLWYRSARSPQKVDSSEKLVKALGTFPIEHFFFVRCVHLLSDFMGVARQGGEYHSTPLYAVSRIYINFVCY